MRPKRMQTVLTFFSTTIKAPPHLVYPWELQVQDMSHRILQKVLVEPEALQDPMPERVPRQPPTVFKLSRAQQQRNRACTVPKQTRQH